MQELCPFSRSNWIHIKLYLRYLWLSNKITISKQLMYLIYVRFFCGSHFSLQPSGDQKQRIPQPFFLFTKLGHWFTQDDTGGLTKRWPYVRAAQINKTRTSFVSQTTKYITQHKGWLTFLGRARWKGLNSLGVSNVIQLVWTPRGIEFRLPK